MAERRTYWHEECAMTGAPENRRAFLIAAVRGSEYQGISNPQFHHPYSFDEDKRRFIPVMPDPAEFGVTFEKNAKPGAVLTTEPGGSVCVHRNDQHSFVVTAGSLTYDKLLSLHR